ncbi:MAG TPA: signal peptidase I [Bryobacteraceae bacterium]|nr:signal peptidase I [Bryobacteraceae bacterium]
MPTITRKLPAPPPQPRKPERLNPFTDWTVQILVLLFGTTTLLQAYIVPTGSMTGTVQVGDQMLVDKLAFAPAGPLARNLLPYRDVQRGDIIVFRYPLDLRENYVKRAIGVPGDRLRFDNKQLILNGRRVEEPYVRLLADRESRYLANFPSEFPDILVERRALEMLAEHVRNGELVVPPGHYFAMGDNRDESADSRFWGLVPRENIIGKPLMIYWSYDAPTEQLRGGLLNPTHLLDVAQHFFTRTRWDRSFRLVRGYPLGR